MNNKLDQVYVINLDMAKDRWEKVTKNLNDHNINHVRFPATNGYKVKITSLKTEEIFFGQDIKDQKKQLNKYEEYKITCDPDSIKPVEFPFKGYINFLGNTISAGELGYWCSQVRIWKDAKSNNYSKIMVFDDDIVPVKNFEQNLINFVSDIPNDFGLAYLGFHLERGGISKVNDNVNTIKKESVGWGSYGVLFSAHGMDTLLSQKIYTYPLDNYFWCLTNGNSGVGRYHPRSECDAYANSIIPYSSSTKLLDVLRLEDEFSIQVMGRDFNGAVSNQVFDVEVV